MNHLIGIHVLHNRYSLQPRSSYALLGVLSCCKLQSTPRAAIVNLADTSSTVL
jgi:hypothetical protein